MMKIFDVLSQQQQKVFVAGAAVLVGVASGAAWWWYRKTTPSKLVFKPVGKLSTILIHPIKSCRGHEVTRAECTANGLRTSNGLTDRHFAILSAENRNVNLRTEPSLALLQPGLSEDGERFILEAPGMEPLNISLADITNTNNPVFDFRLFGLNCSGIYCGQEVGAWISNFLQKPGCKLVFFKETFTKERIPAEDSEWGQKFKSNEKVCGYSDFSQFMMLTEASLDDLNSRLEKKTTMRRFRPNFVVSGAGAFDEDKWKYVKIGDKVIMRRSHACGRCRLTTVDPETGVMSKDNEPLKTLKEFRLMDKSDPDSKILGTSPVFGSNLTCEVAGAVCVGDIVYAAF